MPPCRRPATLRSGSAPRSYLALAGRFPRRIGWVAMSAVGGHRPRPRQCRWTSGLLQAISLTARTAPALIAPDIRELAARLQAGWTPRDALLAFAEALDDTTSDMVVLALLGHLSERGEKLTNVLDDQADNAAAEVVKRRDVYAKRAEPRLVTRFLTGLTVLMLIGGFAVPAYTRPYLTLRGQMLLAVFAVMCIAVMRWVRHLGRSTRGPRLLSPGLVSEEAR